MSKSKVIASGANIIKPQNSRKRLAKTNSESKETVTDDLRKTIRRRYLRDSDLAKVDDKKKSSAKRPAKGPSTDNRSDKQPAGRGKKRDHNGKVLDQDRRASAETTVQAEDGSNEDILEREMKTLGGTAEDLQLLADADSESEIEGDTLDGALEGLDKGLQNIMKEIALAQGDLDDDEEAAKNSEDDQLEIEPEPKTPMPPAQAQDVKPSRAKKANKMSYVCDITPDWFDIADPDVDPKMSLKYRISKDSIDQLYNYARSLLDEENQKFMESQQSSAAQSFYNTVITSGTLSDKISALTLAVQESPLHNVKALETLIALARKRSRSQAVDVLRALKDLFAQGSLLPQSRKLFAFQGQPALLQVFGNTRNWARGQDLPRGLDKRHLLVWAFEAWLKEQYFEILKVLEVWCNDEIEYSKARAVGYVYELLKERPEQESNLLRLLVNKLGDPVKKISSQASYFLMQLLIAHPAMKKVVVSAVESDFIFRPGQNLHGKYYAVVTLNQTALSGKEEDVAVKLLDIYFGLFTDLLKTQKIPAPAKEEVDDKDEPEVRGRRKPNKKPPVAPGQIQDDQLREKLISAILTGVNRAYPYTTSAESSNNAFSDHLNTLFLITHSANFNTSIQALMLIQQISQASQHKASSDRFYRVLYESLLDHRLIVASKSQLYLNLLHRALKADLHVNRVKAFVKRLAQVLSLHEPSFICGAFFLIQDLVKTFPSVKSLIDEPEDQEGDDDIEVFKDVPDEEMPTTEADAPTASTSTTVVGDQELRTSYDAHKRDPLHANASTTCLWDILPFLAHFHPSVSVSASNLLSHQSLSGKPDLNLHTLSHFLDRFVYRNPKLATTGLRGSSIMQPMATENTQAVLLAGKSAKRDIPLNSEAFRVKESGDVAAEDVFFHQYFTAMKKATPMSARERKKAEKKKLRNAEDDGDGSDADEDEIWKAMMQSAPDLEGDEFEDDDMDDGEDLDLAELESDDDIGDDNELDRLPEDDDDDGDGGVDIDPAFFDDDDDDLMDLDTDAKVPTLSAAEVDSDVSDFAGFDAAEKPPKKKSKKEREEQKKEKKRLKNLPTFASAEDYAKMLDDDEDQDR